MFDDISPILLFAVKFIYEVMQEYDNPNKLDFRNHDFTRNFDVEMVKELVETFKKKKTLNIKSLPAYRKLIRLITNVLLIDSKETIDDFIYWVSMSINYEYESEDEFYFHESDLNEIYYIIAWVGIEEFRKDEYFHDIKNMLSISPRAIRDYSTMRSFNAIDDLIEKEESLET